MVPVKRGPKPLWHEVYESASDHDWYRVAYRLPQGGIIIIGTANLSVAAAHHHPEALTNQLAHFAALCDVLVMQEAGAARAIVTAAANQAGRLLWFGTGETGQASTPVMVVRGLGVQFRAYRLLGRRRLAPPAAGPSRSKPKWLMVATLKVAPTAGDRVITHPAVDLVNVCGLHSTPSTRYKLNAIAAGLIFARAERHALALPGWSFLAGDLNQPWWSRLLRVWRSRLRSSQRALGAIDTGPHHTPIDDVYAEVRPR